MDARQRRPQPQQSEQPQQEQPSQQPPQQRQEAKRLWRWCGGFSLGVFATAHAFERIPDIHICGNAGLGAIQDLRTVEEAAAKFACAQVDRLVTAVRKAAYLDGCVFIPVYVTFVCLGLRALAAEESRADSSGRAAIVRKVCAYGIAFTLAGAVGDEIEGMCVLRMLESLPGTPALLQTLVVANRLKTAALAAGLLCASFAALRQSFSSRSQQQQQQGQEDEGCGPVVLACKRAASVAMAAGGVMALIGRAGSDKFPTAGLGIGWTGLLAHAALGMW